MLPYMVPLLEPYLQDLSRLAVLQGQLDVGKEGQQQQQPQGGSSVGRDQIQAGSFADLGDMDEGAAGSAAAVGGSGAEGSAAEAEDGDSEGRDEISGRSKAEATSLAREEREAREARARSSSAKKKVSTLPEHRQPSVASRPTYPATC
jgi:hypothetical protein